MCTFDEIEGTWIPSQLFLQPSVTIVKLSVDNRESVENSNAINNEQYSSFLKFSAMHIQENNFDNFPIAI